MDANNSSNIPEQLAEQLMRGYEALNTECQTLNDQRRELENKLSWAKQQVGRLRYPALSMARRMIKQL